MAQPLGQKSETHLEQATLRVNGLRYCSDQYSEYYVMCTRGTRTILIRGATMRTDPATRRRTDEEEAAALRSGLVDLSGLSLDELDRLPPNALAGSLRRILTESAGQPHSYGQNYASSI